jgi:FkbM family methyltransferase
MKKEILKLYLKLFSRPSMYKFNRMLYILSLKGMGITNYQEELTGESFLLKLIKKRGYNPKIIFDVGANNGDYSLMIRKEFPDSKIFAFEPVKETFKVLEKKTNRANINVYQFGLGEENKTSRIFYGKEKTSPTASVFIDVEKKLGKSNINSEKINIKKIDDFVEDNKIEGIDFLKIDVEGNELNVLKGAKKLIDKNKIKIIQFEFNEMNLISKATFRDFQELLKDYEIYRILPEGLLKLNRYINLDTEIYLFQNLLAILK